MTVEIQLGSTLAGFRIERLLGHGAMGAVYLAEDVHLRRKVAVKVLAREFAEDERFRRRFLLESQLAASLEHPHIVPIYAAGEEGDVLFLAMKYVEGYDLRELIDATENVGEERALGLLSQVADALDTAHGLGLVHRDVKPANILIGAGEAEHAYLCDFGLARHASTAASLTSDRGFVGTIAYVAPEQVESGVVDARADVYSLACVLFECLTGAPPFDRGGDLQVVFAHLKEPPPLVTSVRPDLPEAVDAVVEKALAKAPDDRFSTCSELLAETAEALHVRPPEVARSARRTIAGVRTFLITDVRGYTSYTAEHGDEAAAALASAFAEIVRQVVEDRDGRLIELRGDEALVVFDSARQALRSAVALQEQFAAADLPRGIGIGLDAGEAVPVGEGYRGGALNLAARMCSLAGPGETLATETVLQLARAVDGIRYGERRVERVKGIPKPVTAVEVVPADHRTRRFDRRRLRRSASRTFRKRSVRLGVLALAVVAAATAGALVFTGAGSAHAAIAPQSVGFVSPSGKVEAQLPVSGAGDIGLVGKTLWLANQDDKTFERIDPKTHKLIHPFVSVQNGFGGAAFGEGAVWAVDGTRTALLRVDPTYRTIQSIKLPVKAADIDLTAPTGVAIGAGSVWVADANRVFRIDPNSSPPRVIKTIDVAQADQVAFGDGALWVISDNTSTLSKVDPKLDAVVQTVKLRDWINSVAIGGGFVWATVIPDDTLWKLDENGNVIRTFDMGHEPGPVAFFDGAAWVGSNGKLSRVDPTSDQVTDYAIVDRPTGLALGDGVLYVNTGQSPPRLAPLPANEVVNISLAEDWVDDTDPAHAWPNPFRLQLEYATGAQLLNYPDAAGPRGARLAPEVAAAMPNISDGGRTYTFRIRPGFRFSPPSNEQVTAQTFRSSIERALSPRLGRVNPGIAYLGDVVGAQAFNAGKASHVSGITAHGDLLRIRLVEPSGDFLARLSMPFFSAVPLRTPIVDGGLTTPIPSAGPYFLKEAWNNDIVVLERNPNYHGPRPHRLDRIVYSLSDSTRRSVGEIQTGAADYTADVMGETTFAANGPLAAKYAHARPASPRLAQTPQLGLRYVLFNTTRGPFSDVRLRRAVNYAIDRRALAESHGEIADDAYLPPALEATPPGRAYPLSPDVERARRLAHGFHGTVTLYACTTPDCAAAGRIVAADLQPLGIKVKVVEFDNPGAEAQKPGARYDMALEGWAFDYPDAGAFLNLLFAPAAFDPPWAPDPVALPASARTGLEHAARVTGVRRAGTYARIAGALSRDVAPMAAFSTPVLPEFFSGRVGCVVEQPVVGSADLASLCVK